MSTPTPMMVCGEPTAVPTYIPVSNSFNSVHVGATTGDIAMGWVAIGTSIAVDLAFFFAAGPAKPYDWAKGILGKFLGFSPDAKGIAKFLIKTFLRFAIGGVNAKRTGRATPTVSYGSPHFGIKVSVKMEPGGKETLGGEFRMGSNKWKQEYDSKGTHTSTHETTYPDGSTRTVKTKTKADGSSTTTTTATRYDDAGHPHSVSKETHSGPHGAAKHAAEMKQIVIPQEKPL